MKGIIKKVSTAKFDAIIGKSINLGYCPNCRNIGGKVEILMPCYGKTGVRVSCIYCDYKTKLYGIHTVIFEKGGELRTGTPTIEKSLMQGIRNAINDWNRSNENAE
jgi:hypothetical protein